MDNCTACTTAKVLNGIEGAADAEGWTANEVEANFGYTGKERGFTVGTSLRYVENATDMTAEEAAFMEPDAEAGHYVVFPRVAGQPAQHVIYGQVLEDGTRYLYDAQIGKTMSWSDMLETYSAGAKTFILKDGPK